MKTRSQFQLNEKELTNWLALTTREDMETSQSVPPSLLIALYFVT
jgi:hypothetical protein